jgi:tetratricopeptide (TPR) repeat protein
MGDFLARNARKDDVVLFDWEPYILEYHCGRKDVQKFSTLPDVWGKGKAIWVGMLKPASPSDPFMTAHPPSARITFQSATLAYYSSATSFSLPHFLSGLGLSKRGAEAGSIGNLWKSISPKSARTFFESVDTSHMNRRTQADFYCLFGNLCRETYFVTNDKEALQKAVELLAKSVRLNPYSVYHFLYYGDALLYAGKLKETCRATEQGIKMARPNDIVQLASNGLRAAELIPDARRVAEFLALVLKYQKDPKTRQATIQKCREYLEKTPKSAGLFRKTFKRHGLDINEVLETQ